MLEKLIGVYLYFKSSFLITTRAINLRMYLTIQIITGFWVSAFKNTNRVCLNLKNILGFDNLKIYFFHIELSWQEYQSSEYILKFINTRRGFWIGSEAPVGKNTIFIFYKMPIFFQYYIYTWLPEIFSQIFSLIWPRFLHPSFDYISSPLCHISYLVRCSLIKKHTCDISCMAFFAGSSLRRHPQHAHFTGTIQVIKAVGSHLVLTFCEKTELFTIILFREKNVRALDVSVYLI